MIGVTQCPQGWCHGSTPECRPEGDSVPPRRPVGLLCSGTALAEASSCRPRRRFRGDAPHHEPSGPCRWHLVRVSHPPCAWRLRRLALPRFQTAFLPPSFPPSLSSSLPPFLPRSLPPSPPPSFHSPLLRSPPPSLGRSETDSRKLGCCWSVDSKQEGGRHTKEPNCEFRASAAMPKDHWAGARAGWREMSKLGRFCTDLAS